MIKNIVFDIGNVLAEFGWEKVLKEFGFSENVYETLADAVFRSEDWGEMDRGVMTIEEIIARFCKKAPEYEKEIREVMGAYSRMIRMYPYTPEMIRSLKAQGYQVYYLSNYGEHGYEQTKGELEFLKEMDGGLFSFEVKMIKPCKWIFAELLERFALDPAETVFLDDNLQNAEAASRMGMTGIHFLGYEQAKEQLAALGVVL